MGDKSEAKNPFSRKVTNGFPYSRLVTGPCPRAENGDGFKRCPNFSTPKFLQPFTAQQVWAYCLTAFHAADGGIFGLPFAR